jgi:hypothetical protein
MSKHQKAVARLVSKPKDFVWAEFRSLMEGFGYDLLTVGGSGRKFVNPKTGAGLFIHEPHPSKVLKEYQLNLAIQFLTQENHLP